jgi:hypothetical protein
MQCRVTKFPLKFLEIEVILFCLEISYSALRHLETGIAFFLNFC